MIKEIKSKEELSEVLYSSEGNFLLKFFAPWCQPCKVLKESISQLEDGLPVPTYSVDIDVDPEVCTRLGVRSVPTLILFDGKKIVDRRTGKTDVVTLKDWLNEVVK